MEDFNMNTTSQNFYDHYDNFTHCGYLCINRLKLVSVGTWIIICLGLPLSLMAIYSLLSLVRNNHVAPIYVINLLISDIIQFCCMIVEMVGPEDRMIHEVFHFIYSSSLVASVLFMVCISLQRYLLIVHPVWYRFRRTIKTSVVVCVLVWVLTATIEFFLAYFCSLNFTIIFKNVFFLLPFPLLIFFLGATLKALSASISVPSDEKRRVVGMLVLVLLIYTLLFLPYIIFLDIKRPNSHFRILSLMFLRLSPLADLLLYIFWRKGTVNNLCSSSVCCRRIQGNDINSSVITMTTHPQSAS